MFWQEIKNIKSSNKDICSFGLVVGGALLLVTGFMWLRLGDAPIILGIIAGILIVLGLLAPNVLRPLQKIWMTLALLLGWIMTRIILSVLFYGVITPIGLIAHIFGNDFLDMKKKESTQTYWRKREMQNFTKELYERQY